MKVCHRLYCTSSFTTADGEYEYVSDVFPVIFSVIERFRNARSCISIARSHIFNIDLVFSTKSQRLDIFNAISRDDLQNVLSNCYNQHTADSRYNEEAGCWGICDNSSFLKNATFQSNTVSAIFLRITDHLLQINGTLSVMFSSRYCSWRKGTDPRRICTTLAQVHPRPGW